MAALPATQFAVRLVGPGKMELDRAKPVPALGPTQFLARVEAVGLCFSDLKLLKQFGAHVRKGPVTGGLSDDVLAQIPSYVSNDKPTVPGHEVVCEIVAVGSGVRHHEVGRRYLIQPDFRALPTAGANAAFGYNFEGALQEYVLLDERVVIEPGGERYLLPVAEHLGSSQAALSEPWACVEDSYVTVERSHLAPGGRLLVAADPGRANVSLDRVLALGAKPASITALALDPTQVVALQTLGIPVEFASDAASLPNESFDDIIYFGSRRDVLESLNPKLAARAIMNVVRGATPIGEVVSAGVGRIHYGLTRWIGTAGEDASASYGVVPANGELRDGDAILVVGAGGPMGQMHVIRALCSGRRGISVVAADMDDERLAALARKAEPFARANNVSFRTLNTTHRKPSLDAFTYIVLMAPVPQLLSDAIAQSREGAVINLFAGIPAPVCHPIDLDRVIEERLFIFGTSGSSLEDMRIILRKVTEGSLDTDASVDAISGMAGAIEGIAAVENRTMAGKIVVYPVLRDVGLIPLSGLGEHFPTVAARLRNGQWCREAEQELLRVGRRTT